MQNPNQQFIHIVIDSNRNFYEFYAIRHRQTAAI